MKGHNIMKKIIMIFIFIIVIVVTSCSSNDNKYENGLYTGQAEGHHGTISVQVNINNNVISQINITKEQEIPGLKEIVYDKVPKQIIKKNTWDVDGVSGATLTSNGLINAVKDAIRDCKIDEK